MPHDPLETVLKLRRAAVDEARRALGQGLAAVGVAQAAARREEQAIVRETARATDPDGGDELVEAFATWLPGARRRAEETRAWQERLEAEVACRRADLAASRTAFEAVEQLMAERKAQRMLGELRRERQAMEEGALRRLE